MSVSGFRTLVDEARRVGFAVRDDGPTDTVGPIAVSGMLAEQLVKELSAGADLGSVVVGGVESASRAEVLVRIVAGDPTPEDDELVRVADAHGTGVVLVQLWPQADWTRPFVLTPFVVECEAGKGFPIAEIAASVVAATERSTALAARTPALADAARKGAMRSAVIRAGLTGLVGSRRGASRQLLTLEQVRLLSQLRAVSGAGSGDELHARAVGAGAVVASGLALRRLARSLRELVPAPLANAAVAAGGTWALAKLLEAAESRLSAK